MDILKFLLKALPVLITLAATAARFYDLWTSRLPTFKRVNKNKARHEYEFLEEFLQIPVDERHPIEVEQAFNAYKGWRIPYMDIKSLLAFDNPTVGFTLFKSARYYVELDESGQYVYRSSLDSLSKRRFKITFWTSAYFVLTFLACSPMWFSLINPGYRALYLVHALIVPSLFGFGALAVAALDTAVSMKISESFLQEQARNRRHKAPLSALPSDQTETP